MHYAYDMIEFSKVTPAVHPPHVGIIVKVTSSVIIPFQESSSFFQPCFKSMNNGEPFSPGTSHNIIIKLVFRAATYGTLEFEARNS
jgi:hypothetical protein